jgi:hypothetical protein
MYQSLSVFALQFYSEKNVIIFTIIQRFIMLIKAYSSVLRGKLIGFQPNMDLIKMEPNTDGEIQPTFFVSDVKEEQNCLTLLKTEGLVSYISTFVFRSLAAPRPYS